MKGDPVLVTANNYDEDADLRNGDLGLVVEVFEQPDENDAVAVIEVNNALLTGSIALKRKIFMS